MLLTTYLSDFGRHRMYEYHASPTVRKEFDPRTWTRRSLRNDIPLERLIDMGHGVMPRYHHQRRHTSDSLAVAAARRAHLSKACSTP